MKIDILKRAVEDVLVRKPDLDEKKAPKIPDAPDGTTKAEEAKSEISADKPETAVTDKAATWAELDPASQAYVAGFVGACKEAGANPELWLPADLVKDAQAALLGKLVGLMGRVGGKAMSVAGSRAGQLGSKLQAAAPKIQAAAQTAGQKVQAGLTAAGQKMQAGRHALNQKALGPAIGAIKQKGQAALQSAATKAKAMTPRQALGAGVLAGGAGGAGGVALAQPSAEEAV